MPLSHILWSHVWLGIATEAFERGRAFVRAARAGARASRCRPRISLSRVMSELTMLRAEVTQALADFSRAVDEPGRERADRRWRRILRFNNLKLAASEQAPRICAGRARGRSGSSAYKNDSPYGVGRHLRDALSARLMVANERIHAIDAGAADDRQGGLVTAVPTEVRPAAGPGRVPATSWSRAGS